MSEALLEVRDLVKTYRRRRGLFGRPDTVCAVNGVSFELAPRETFGLVGESGSGKTTTARCILRLDRPTSGSVRFDGTDLLALTGGELRRARRRMQMVFQDPWSSLDPRMRARDIVEEPLAIHGLGSRAERRERVAELFRLVGLEPSHLGRYPREFSGGQRQRIGLARALALEPSLLVADEPVSALDRPVQAQIVDLILGLKERLGLTCLFIAHDLALVERTCTRAAVMYRGRIVETGSTSSLFAAPAHPYTRALLSAVPVPDPDRQSPRVEWDPTRVDLDAPLREVGNDHFARL